VLRVVHQVDSVLLHCSVILVVVVVVFGGWLLS
jgi:hypothetical protein